jgi:filamentous hemagglutinin family protein
LAPVTTVAFNNGAGAKLNRVVGSHPSVIIGHLSATGSVYLINPQGVIVGPRVGCAS